MCRVLLMNKQGEEEIEKNYGLDRYLRFLEKQLGGHGNGFSLLKNGKVISLKKGVNLDVRDIANAFRKTDYDWALFHTRLASVGTISDKNCHPFRNGNIVLAMNGTEKSVDFLSNTLDITDTEAILDILCKYHLELPALKKLNSIFMGFYNGNPFVVADNVLNIKVYRNKKALAFASDFPYKFKNTFVPKECFFTSVNLDFYCKSIPSLSFSLFLSSFFSLLLFTTSGSTSICSNTGEISLDTVKAL